MEKKVVETALLSYSAWEATMLIASSLRRRRACIPLPRIEAMAAVG